MSYVYIGQLERQLYDVRTDKFEDETYFELVYQGSVQIYKVKKEFMSFWFLGETLKLMNCHIKIQFIQIINSLLILE